LELLNDISHGKGLTATRDPQQGLGSQTGRDTSYQLLDGPRLITGGFVTGLKFESLCHSLDTSKVLGRIA
jgi:hypothetical protein